MALTLKKFAPRMAHAVCARSIASFSSNKSFSLFWLSITRSRRSNHRLFGPAPNLCERTTKKKPCTHGAFCQLPPVYLLSGNAKTVFERFVHSISQPSPDNPRSVDINVHRPFVRYGTGQQQHCSNLSRFGRKRVTKRYVVNRLKEQFWVFCNIRFDKYQAPPPQRKGRHLGAPNLTNRGTF